MAGTGTFTGRGAGRSRWRVGITLLVVSIYVLAVGLSCPSERSVVSPANPERPAGLTVFLTGYELGSLRPCGCSGGQLGGLEKRSAVFDTVSPANRLIVETGGLVQADSEQELIKFRIFMEAMQLLEYDVVNLTEHDLDVAERLGMLAHPEFGFDVIQAAGAGRRPSSTKRFSVQGRDVAVNVASLDPQAISPEQAGSLFEEIPGVVAVNVLIISQCSPDFLENARRQVLSVDCVICPSDSDEPRLLSEPGERPLVLTVGRFGRYICRLGVTVPPGGGEAVLEFVGIPVGEKLPDHPALSRLYGQYQQLVAESHLLEKHPRVPFSSDIVFLGSKACKRCHGYEYDQWSTKAHAEAFATLVEVGSHQDPECVICHVVGMDYESGFISEAATPHLKDVGCENCHGPGSKHVLTQGAEPTSRPRMTCLDCHTPEKSTGFAGHEEEYMKKIIHWREPTAARNVQQP